MFGGILVSTRLRHHTNPPAPSLEGTTPSENSHGVTEVAQRGVNLNAWLPSLSTLRAMLAQRRGVPDWINRNACRRRAPAPPCTVEPAALRAKGLGDGEADAQGTA